MAVERRFTSAVFAGLIVAIGAVGTITQIGTVGSEGLFGRVAGATTLPGFYVALFRGLGRGAHGFPTQDDVAPYLIAFALWWIVIDQGRAWWRRQVQR